MKFAKAQKGECVVCTTKIPKMLDSYSPEPILPDNHGKCCKDCYVSFVLPARQIRSRYGVLAKWC